MLQNSASVSSRTLPALLQTADGLAHQLGTGAEIPVGIAHVDVPKISRQDRQARFDLDSGPVPTQQGLNREAMTEVMQSRAMACRRRAQPDLSRQEIEGPVYVSDTEAIASFGHEQVRRIAPSQKASTPLEIADEHLPRGAVDRYQAGLAIFRSTNRQDVLVQVDVVQF